jgi:hypothetical protein
VPTYIQTNKASDLSPYTGFNLELDPLTGMDDTLVVMLLAGLSMSGGFILKSGKPNSDDWNSHSGTWSVYLEVDVAESLIDARCRAVQLDATGTVITNGVWGAAQTMAESRTLVSGANTWGAGDDACGNRLAVEVEFTNTDAGNPVTCTIGLGTSANIVTTDITEDAGTCVPTPAAAPWTEKTVSASSWTEKTRGSNAWREKHQSREGHVFTYNGTVSLADTVTQADSAALSENIPDLSRAIVFLSPMGEYRSGSMVTPQLIHDGGQTKVRITRYDEADAKDGALTVGFWVVETRTEDWSVETTEIVVPAGTDQVTTDTFTQVDTTRAIIVVHGRVNEGYTAERDGYFTAEFTGIDANNKSSTATYTRRDNGGSSGKAATLHRQVVSFAEKTGIVTHMLDEFDCSGDLSSGKQHAHGKGIPTGRTWIYPTFRHNVNNLESLSLRTEMIDANTVEYERFSTTNSYASWARTYLVVWPSGVTVNHLLGVTGLAGDTTWNKTVSAVTLGQAFIFHTNNSASLAQWQPRNKWRNEYTSTTNVRLTRNASPNNKSQFGLQSIDFSGWQHDQNWTEKVVI